MIMYHVLLFPQIKEVLRHIGANHKQTCPELEKVKECITEALQVRQSDWKTLFAR